MEFCLLNVSYKHLNNIKEVRKNIPIYKNDFFRLPNMHPKFAYKCSNTMCYPINNETAAWSEYKIPENGFKNNSWIEVSRIHQDPTNMGFWMYMSPGSTQWFNLKKTISFRSHREAMLYFCPHGCTLNGKFPYSLKRHPEMQFVGQAHVLGFDSIQFPRLLEWKATKSEVVFTRLNVMTSQHKTRHCNKFNSYFKEVKSCASFWVPTHRCRMSP